MSIKKILSCILATMLILSSASALGEAQTRPNIICHKMDSVTIDGDLSEWNLDSPAVVKDATQVIRDLTFWQGENDLSMTVYTGYDDDNLYLAFDVVEDTVYGAIEMLPIDGEDNLKLYISTNPDADPERTAYGTNDFLVYLIMDEGYWDTAIDRSMVPKDDRQRFVSMGMDGGENVIEGYVCGTKRTTTGFIFECAIPWATFSNKNIPVYQPASGDTLSVNFVVTDISYPCPGTEYMDFSPSGGMPAQGNMPTQNNMPAQNSNGMDFNPPGGMPAQGNMPTQNNMPAQNSNGMDFSPSGGTPAQEDMPSQDDPTMQRVAPNETHVSDASGAAARSKAHASQNDNDWLLFGGSMAALLAGLLIALVMKPQNR